MTPPLGVVCLPALDLRVRPDHRAEMGSQLLLGETVRLGAARDGWRRVTGLADEYGGWARAWGIVDATRTRAAAWRRRATARIVAPLAVLRGRPAGGIGVGPIFFGSRAIPGKISRGWVRLELPDARFGWIERAALALPGDARPTVTDRVTSLLGAPYLWGGRTPAGYDCSAFVQQVLLEQGIPLPRDAAEQHRACRPLRGSESPRPGDLVFFEDRPGRVAHVGLSLAGGVFAHARGRVVLGSLEPGNDLYDSELALQAIGWYRPRPGRRRESGLT